MPNIDTASIANGVVGAAYSQDIVASKVVGMAVTRSGPGAIADGGSDAVGEIPTASATEYTYTLGSDSEDDLVIGAVTISGQSNCSVVITTDPEAVVVEPGSDTPLVIEVTPTADGAWSFNISIANDTTTGEDPYNWGVNGTATSVFTLHETFDGAFDHNWTEQYNDTTNSWEAGDYRRLKPDTGFTRTIMEVDGSAEAGSDGDLHPPEFQAWVRYKRNLLSTNMVPLIYVWATAQTTTDANELMAFRASIDFHSLRITAMQDLSSDTIAGSSSASGESVDTDIWFYIRCWLNNDGERHVEAYVVSGIDEVPNFGVDTPNIDCVITYNEDENTVSDYNAMLVPTDLPGVVTVDAEARFYFGLAALSGGTSWQTDYGDFKIETLPPANKPADTTFSDPSGQTFHDPFGVDGYLNSADASKDANWANSPGNGGDPILVRGGYCFGVNYSSFAECFQKYEGTFHAAAPNVDQWFQWDQWIETNLVTPVLRPFMEDTSGDNDPYTLATDSFRLQLRHDQSRLYTVEGGADNLEDSGTYTATTDAWVTMRVEVTHSGGTTTFTVKQGGSTVLTLTCPTASIPANAGRRFGFGFDKSNSNNWFAVVRNIRAGTL